MGRITKLQNDVGHLQEVLATKNTRIAETEKLLKALTKERDDALAKIVELTTPKDKAAA